MMTTSTILALLDRAFHDAIQRAFGFDADPAIAVSQNPTFGDYQSNAAMALAKQVTEKSGQKTNPRQVAERIKAELNLGEMASEISIAGPGFLNVKLSPEWVATQLTALKDAIREQPVASSRQKVVVDYSGPNIAKQMHVGHLRSTIIGDAIARIVAFEGDEVVRQNHIGDWGTQFGMLISFLKWTGIGSDAPIEDLEDFYRRAKQKFDAEEAFQGESRSTVVRLQGGSSEELASWKKIVDETRRDYQPIYARLNVQLTQTDERGESFYNRFLADVVKELKEKNIAVESDGAIVVFVPGYEHPLIIQKSDGGFLYGTTDLAAIRFRITALGATRIIYTHDSRQAQHFAQVFWTAKQAGWAEGMSLEYAPFGTMLGEDNKPFKTRSGTTVKLKDLLDEAEKRGYEMAVSKDADRINKARERGDTDMQPLTDDELKQIGTAIGIGGVKYSDLSKDRTSDYVFSFDKMLAMDGNTAPYLQYAYARIKSIFRKAGAATSASSKITLEAPQELALAKHILRFQEVIDAVARELKPHLLTNYLYELATRFSSFYENCDVLKSDEPLRSSRLAIANATAITMAQGLDLLGIEHPEKM